MGYQERGDGTFLQTNLQRRTAVEVFRKEMLGAHATVWRRLPFLAIAPHDVRPLSAVFFFNWELVKSDARYAQPPVRPAP